jgi:ribosomal protein S12 methylthiotransferase
VPLAAGFNSFRANLNPGPQPGFFWGGPQAISTADSFSCLAAPRVPSKRMDHEPTSASPSSPPNFARPTPKISFVSLGCPKALVDSERIIGRLRAEGYELAKSHRDAAAVIVNTCGFLDSAKAESLAAIGAAAGQNGKVIVTGCLGAEPAAILEKFPDLRWISGPHDFGSVMRAVHEAPPPPHNAFVDLLPPQGIKLTPRHYAYLKISEGCNNRCSFCIIPKLRGGLVSRAASDVLCEAEKLVAAGSRNSSSSRKIRAPMDWT